MNYRLVLLAAALSIAAAGTARSAEWTSDRSHFVPHAQPGDPARWFDPADTPEKKYATAMKEAAAALKENLIECRELEREARAACERSARAQHLAEVAIARGHLASRSGS